MLARTCVAALALLLTVACGGDDELAPTDDGAGAGAAGGGGVGGGGVGGAGGSGTGGADLASPGCGQAPQHPLGGVQVTFDAGLEADGMRSFYLSLPAGYDPARPHKLVIGYAGTNWVGEQIQPYLDLETVAPADDEIFVYPDPLWRDFEGWGYLGGWLLGPHADNAAGDADLAFTAALIDHLADNYCIDRDRIFATGHSWGGDMAMVAGCFLGDVVRAVAPAAANEPYWFWDAPGSAISCAGSTAVWTFFGAADDHFTWQDYPGEFGDSGRDFWLTENQCDGVNASVDLGLGAAGECVEYQGCSEPTRYCLYDASYGHQIPDAYFAAETMAFFRSF